MPPKTEVRKGARTVASVDSDVLAQLQAGTLESANLTEGLAINMANLLAVIAPTLPKNSIDLDIGIVQRMAQAGSALGSIDADFTKHSSDTVRGWAAFALGQNESIDAMKRLKAIKVFAADTHFGVREWAWMAVRAIVVAQPLEAIKVFTPWTKDKDANVRRFASEATRPRGVWAASVPLLRKEPEHALPILEALRFDSEKYVEDSVGNWLNDAAKDQPGWVQHLLSQWERGGVADRLIKRARRSLK
jgi:3-methyladenine DNA glycosylase AlkC